MFVYAGIDEAGYGPLFGPLLIARAVIGIPKLDPTRADDRPPQLWQRLSRAVCRTHSGARGRIVVNDSKKVHSGNKGLHHLERGVLSFAALGGLEPPSLDRWLDGLGETSHHRLDATPWYQPSHELPWQPLPCACTPGEIAVARNLLGSACKRIGIEVLGLGAAVVFEDRFNRMVAATRSKASTSFTFVAAHLRHLWEQHGKHRPVVVVDRQSGRMHYRELLQQCFEQAQLTVIEENQTRSAYRLEQHRSADDSRAMTVSFEVEADGSHLPVALASMIAKYTRELLMARFQAFFNRCAPDIKPTAGYALDAKRFWQEIEPRLTDLSLDGAMLRRQA